MTEHQYQEPTGRETRRGGHRSPDELKLEIEETRQQMTGTLHELQDRLTPGDMFGRSYDVVRDAAADGTKVVVDTMRQHPVPAAVIGLGIGLMVMEAISHATTRQVVGRGVSRIRHRARGNGGRYESVPVKEYLGEKPASWREQLGEQSAELREQAGEKASEWRERSGEMTEQAREKTAEWRERAGEMTEQARERAAEMAGKARERASEFTSQAKEKIGSMAHQTRERAGHMAGRARERAGELAHQASVKTSELGHAAREGFGHAVQDHPLVVCLAGVAVGAAIGASLPSTRVEDEWMGEASDTMTGKARQVGEEVREGARNVLESVKETAKAEGQRIAEDVKQGAQRVMEQTEETARREAEQRGMNPPI